MKSQISIELRSAALFVNFVASRNSKHDLNKQVTTNVRKVVRKVVFLR